MQQNPDEYYLDGILGNKNLVLLDIYKEFLPGIKRFVIREGGGPDEAEDVFNQALTDIFARLKNDGIQIHKSFSSYLFVTCRNLWRKECAKKIKERVTKETFSEHMDKTTTEETVREQERWALFEEKFAELSEKCREILGLHLKKISGREIMERLGYASETTVRQRIFKCKSRLVQLVRTDRRYKI